MLGFSCSLALCGCAVVEDVQPDGKASRSLAFALPLALPSEPGTGHVLKVAGLGVASTKDGFTLGLFNSSEIALDPRCQVVLVGNTDEELKRFVHLVHNVQNVCTDTSPPGVLK
jgi:hypothetical protein